MGTELQKWADQAMFESEPVESVVPKVYLLQATPDPLGGIAAMSKMYKGEVVRDLYDVSDEEREHYWTESQKTHLRAPHESVDFHFMIEGVTRAFTHQMVRQRTAVYAQESLRFAVKSNLPEQIAFPPSIEQGSDEAKSWDEVLQKIEEVYTFLINNGIPAEDARGLLPHAITTRLHYKTNLRNLVEHAGNRLCTQAQFEWRIVFTGIVQAIRYYSPAAPIDKYSGLPTRSQAWQFERIARSDLFRPVCYAQGKCPFNADFDRGCTIRPRVEAGEFDKIDDREWLFDPTAARR